MASICQVFKWLDWYSKGIWKLDPFGIHHLNTRLVQYSDPHCNQISLWSYRAHLNIKQSTTERRGDLKSEHPEYQRHLNTEKGFARFSNCPTLWNTNILEIKSRVFGCHWKSKTIQKPKLLPIWIPNMFGICISGLHWLILVLFYIISLGLL